MAHWIESGWRGEWKGWSNSFKLGSKLCDLWEARDVLQCNLDIKLTIDNNI